MFFDLFEVGGGDVVGVVFEMENGVEYELEF